MFHSESYTFSLTKKQLNLPQASNFSLLCVSESKVFLLFVETELQNP